MATKTKLTPKQKIFVAEYLKTRNGTKASLKVQPNQTPASAGVTASRTLKNASVQKAIDDALETLGLTPEFAVANIGKIAGMTETQTPAALRANERLLQLHGWNEKDKPVVQIEISDFFKTKRTTIEGEVVD